jgi:hypothetical protein
VANTQKGHISDHNLYDSCHSDSLSVVQHLPGSLTHASSLPTPIPKGRNSIHRKNTQPEIDVIDASYPSHYVPDASPPPNSFNQRPTNFHVQGEERWAYRSWGL